MYGTPLIVVALLAVREHSAYGQVCTQGSVAGGDCGLSVDRGDALLQQGHAKSKARVQESLLHEKPQDERHQLTLLSASPRQSANLKLFASKEHSEQYRFVEGEYHRLAYKTGRIEEMLKRPQCVDFFAKRYQLNNKKEQRTDLANQLINDGILDQRGRLKQKEPVTAGVAVIDKALRVMRPAGELPENEYRDSAGYYPGILPPTVFKRMRTYEDVAFPVDYHDTNVTGTTGDSSEFQQERYCQIYAVRTAYRPVKVMTAVSNATPYKNLTMAAIWKVATTSLTSMLQSAALNSSTAKASFGPHAENKNQCVPPNVLHQCEKHTTFQHPAKDGNVKAAIVRSPLDRFLASVFEHGEWKTCEVNRTRGLPCPWMLAEARTMAKRLANDFPHKYRSCEHPTQAYFFSATDVHGEPYEWDNVDRLEDFDTALQRIHNMTGILLSKHEKTHAAMVKTSDGENRSTYNRTSDGENRSGDGKNKILHENKSGDGRNKRMYFDAIFSDLETLCSVCKVYAQDFECLGYAKPDRCTPHLCATVNVTLDYWEENLSSEFESGWRQAEFESLSSELDSLSSGNSSF